MKRQIVALALFALAACSDGAKAPNDSSTAGAAVASAETAAAKDPDKIELRLTVPKSALPASMQGDEPGKAKRVAMTPDELAAIGKIFGAGGQSEKLGPGCFRVCEKECHEVGGGTGTVCVSHCSVECF